MQLAAHEAHDLHELAMSCVNSITNMAYFLQHVQDAELKGIIERHFPLHIQDYNMKAEYLGNVAGATTKLQVPMLNQSLQSYTQSPATSYPPVMPRTQVQDFNDREIATAYLLTLKRTGREYAWAAMEAANPEVRTFLEDAFRMSSRHAYDVWQWMVKKGYYPLEPAPQATLQTMGNFYQTVQQPVPTM
ncbi:spore coat protein [Aneurinibacillus migulanus]|uniref:spore coat protein n=1 Tax=Aneurinibacillus migulanus TaxID=47500 RepID=UPI0020A01C5E|nr:spore coat protein [Aneurinibacillus migulanus]MCP1359089.1 spore coat protein [Aneurinibacillus migulanus]